MKSRKGAFYGIPLSPEEEHEVCAKCNGFCCKYYFINPGESKEGLELHKFRQRNLLTYGKTQSMILADKCPWSDDTLHVCTKYGDPSFPKLCSRFPHNYRPFWNLRCKLMRERYKRGQIPLDVVGFDKLLNAIKKRVVFKIYK